MSVSQFADPFVRQLKTCLSWFGARTEQLPCCLINAKHTQDKHAVRSHSSAANCQSAFVVCCCVNTAFAPKLPSFGSESAIWLSHYYHHNHSEVNETRSVLTPINQTGDSPGLKYALKLFV